MDLESQIMALRESGMTFKAAGEHYGITASRARHLYLRASRRKTGRKPVWTDGLSDRLATLLRWLEFANRDEVTQAFRSGHIQRLVLHKCGISAANLLELEQWLDAHSKLTQPLHHGNAKHCKGHEVTEGR